jgi:hypothetical protein
MKTHNPTYKLFSGIIMFAASSAYIFNVENEDRYHAEKYLREVFLSFLPPDLAFFLTSIICLVVQGTILVWFVKGFYRIKTFDIYLEEFED